jgi:hypothetical protein
VGVGVGLDVLVGVGEGVMVTTATVKLTGGVETPICVTELSHRVA